MGYKEHFYSDRNDVLIMLSVIPLYVVAIGKYGLRMFLALLISVIVGTITEFAAFKLRKKEIGLFGTPAWVLFPLILPPVFPLWMTGVSLFSGVVLRNVISGDHIRVVTSPVALGWMFATLSFPSAFQLGWSLPFPNLTFGFSRYAAAVLTTEHPLQYIDTRIFRLPHPIITVFQGNIPQTPGTAIPYVVILCGMALLLLRVIDFRICFAFTGTVAALSIGWHAFFPASSQHLLELFIGNLVFAAFFILADFRMAPITKEGRWITGIIVGIFTILFRYLSPFPDGVFFAILLGNLCSPILDNHILQLKYRHIQP